MRWRVASFERRAMLDYLTAIHNRIWQLLEAHAPFVDRVLPGNRIKFNDNRSDPLKLAINDADTPHVTVGQGDFSDSMFTLTPNYAYPPNVTVANLSWVERITQVYVINMVSRDLQITLHNELKLIICTALRKGGPHMGLGYVQSWGPAAGAPQIVIDDETGNRKRFVSRIAFPVTVQFNGRNQLS